MNNQELESIDVDVENTVPSKDERLARKAEIMALEAKLFNLQADVSNLKADRLNRKVEKIKKRAREALVQRHLIGLLAFSLSDDVDMDVKPRVNLIKGLMKMLNLDHEIDVQKCKVDGLWMRDCWDGPFGGLDLTLTEKEQKRYETELFWLEPAEL
jgi:hypothetical protein